MGMLNSVGLQNGGVEHWLASELPPLAATGARVVASLWGFTVDDYAKGATMLADAPASVVAVEVNVSCPNVEDRSRMFAHSATATAEAVAAAVACKPPPPAQQRPNVTDPAAITRAALHAPAEAPP